MRRHLTGGGGERAGGEDTEGAFPHYNADVIGCAITLSRRAFLTCERLSATDTQSIDSIILYIILRISYVHIKHLFITREARSESAMRVASFYLANKTGLRQRR